MGVPAGLAQDVPSLHGLVAGDEVLDGAGLDMADVGLAVGRGRAVEEGKFLAALAVLDGLCKDVVLLPEMDGLDLALDKIEIRGDFFKHATTPPKKYAPSLFGTRSSRYHPSWRKAPAHSAQKRACAVTGVPGAAYWHGAFGLPLRGDPLRVLPPGSHHSRLAWGRGMRRQSPSRRFYHYYSGKTAFVKGPEG